MGQTPHVLQIWILGAANRYYSKYPTIRSALNLTYASALSNCWNEMTAGRSQDVRPTSQALHTPTISNVPQKLVHSEIFSSRLQIWIYNISENFWLAGLDERTRTSFTLTLSGTGFRCTQSNGISSYSCTNLTDLDWEFFLSAVEISQDIRDHETMLFISPTLGRAKKKEPRSLPHCVMAARVEWLQ